MKIKTAISGIILSVLSGVSFSQTFGATQKIWQQKSLYRNIIVLEGNGYRCLTFGKRSARQSCIENENPQKLIFGYTQRIFEAIKLIPEPSSVLVIGIGGGSLPMAIRNHFPNTQIDAVELDAEVIKVAERYFQFKPDLKLSVFAEDGRVFIRKSLRRKIKYDVIVLDAFDKDYIPEHMASVEFIKQIQKSLSPHGILLSNTYKDTKFAPYEESTYQKVFGVIQESLIDNGNRIIIAGHESAKIAERLPDSGPVAASKAPEMTDRYSPANALLIH